MTAVLVLLSMTATVAIDTTHGSDFVQWMSIHRKSYSNMEEFMYRLSVYKQTDALLRDTVASGIVRESTIGHNKFSDRSLDERGGSRYSRPEKLNSQAVYQDPRAVGEVCAGYNEIINYCGGKTGACNPVQDQGDQCMHVGGAFATIAGIEVMYNITGGNEMVKLSEQTCIDCAYKQKAGCISAALPELCMSWA